MLSVLPIKYYKILRPIFLKRSAYSVSSDDPGALGYPDPNYKVSIGTVRLSKLLSSMGHCSRREADEFIAKGFVFVDGKVCCVLGTRVLPTQNITLSEEARTKQSCLQTILLNKPAGYVSHPDDLGRYPDAKRLVVPARRWSRPQERGTRLPFSSDGSFDFKAALSPAGRLDFESTGLLVLTQDGRIAKQLIGDESSVDKEYLVRIDKRIPDESLELLRHGLYLDDRPLKPCTVQWHSSYHSRPVLQFVLNEGRKRQIRRMCALVGARVIGLTRIRIGRIEMGDLPVGRWRLLGPGEYF